ncbi:heterocyst specific ABC-transporter, membrane fusion protein DevB homolog [Scytonema sp. HK-05]|uniref:ABC exporter membrane fusion protein n=1 Tax=Scytonema sp. HK-05 TaxID=1137095 RepID=UPI0009369542|nr:ABC exporter membrane fusion protein [Scytonema sp. HK-05]OKH56137.1 HlyD family secretion protein [Scytonema sp. HK-05]BAY48958.1 heterocyst specific ABC-transporter, membrane fusion protein DevB homolog [Scytonema sp. HK-05]
MNVKVLSKPGNRWLIGLVVGATAITGGIVFYGISQYGMVSQKPAPKVETAPPVKKVTALGRLEPEAEVINLSAPLALDGDRIAQLLVKEGDNVKAGQVVALLDSRDKLQDALSQAQEQVKMAQAKLAQVKAGAKSGEIVAQKATIERLQAQLQSDRLAQEQAIARLEAQWLGDRTAQEATIRRLEAQLNNAQAEDQRYQQLYKEGAESRSLFDSKRLALESAQQQLNEAKAVLNRINTTASKQVREANVALQRINITGVKQIKEANATLNKIAEVRPVDVQAAQAEVDNAFSAVKRAQTDLEQAYIKAPTAGRILKIHTRVGEKISDSGIADLGQTEQMVAVAEVYQSDISKVKTGQKAVVKGQGFNGELQGTVSLIGLQVNRQNVFSNQPGENLDKRVIEVKIRLTPEDSKRVAGLTNLQVQTAIEL